MFPPCFTMFDRKERYSTQKKKIEKKDMQLVRNSSGKSTRFYSFCVASVMGLNFFTLFVKCWKAVTQNGSENKVLSG